MDLHTAAGFDSDHVCPVAEAELDPSPPGLIDPSWCFSHYRGFVESLPGELSEADVTQEELCLFDDGRISLYYAPFDWTNRSASVTLVGITPGRRQALDAWNAARAAVDAGATEDDALAAAKRTAAFAGTMRTNLTKMLDAIELPQALGIRTSESLFADDSAMLDSTSAVLYPTLVGGKNYGGASPAITRAPILRAFVEQILTTNLALASDTLVIPLGKAASGAIELLVRQGRVDEDRCLVGFPHPSGGNGHRVVQLAELKEQLTEAVRRWARGR